MHYRRLLWTALPLLVFLLMALMFWRGLYLDPRKIPSTLIGKPVPAFNLSSLSNQRKRFTADVFRGQISLLHVWASWCSSCRIEHPMLMAIANQRTELNIVGLDYKDVRNTAKTWLSEAGSPYQVSLFDPNGDLAIDLGVYGTPELFVIDRQGVIRYKHIGPLTKQAWLSSLLPLIQQLQSEGRT